MGGDHFDKEGRAGWENVALLQKKHDNALRFSRVGRDYIEPVYLAPCDQDRELATGPRFESLARFVGR